MHAALDALYAELPTIDCQGFCHDSCGPIDMSSAERARIAEQGVTIERGAWFTDLRPIRCPALTMFRQCSVYQIRPLICRIWGLTKRMPCTYGCRPSRWLSEPEAYALLGRAFTIAGDEADAAAFTHAAANPAAAEQARDLINARIGR